MQKLENGAADRRAGDRCRGVGRKHCVFHLSRVINVQQLIFCTLPVFALLSGCGKGETTSHSVSVVEPTKKVAPFSTQATSSYNETAALPSSNPVIDVWNLKREVAMLEPLVTTDDTDGCYQEGDPDVQESQLEMDARGKSEQACVENIRVKYAEYQRAREAFNKVWLPVMMDALKKGDLVAEVIMRQCDITPVFDRSGIESSCDQDPQRRIIAAKRLREIGFAPAFDLEGYVQPTRSEIQRRLLERFRQGMFNITQMELANGTTNGNLAQGDAELEEYRRTELIFAVMQDVQRAFTYSSAFQSLSLFREPLTPGCLTWGRGVCGSTGSLWRSKPLEVYVSYGGSPSKTSIAYQGDAAFMSMLHETLAAADANIDRYLAQDKRWSVFLLNRVDFHEWVPEGMESDTGKLEKEWLGEWKLEKSYIKWKAAPVPENLGATIYADGAVTRIRFHIGDAGIGEVPCDLRYSGGKTSLSVSSGDLRSIEETNISGGKPYFSVSSGSESRLSSNDTPLGDIIPKILGITGFGPSLLEPFSPLDPKVQYPQVLVQCPQGEWPDSDRVRFLLRANDTLIEVLYEPGSKDLIMRHYRNSTVALPPKASPKNEGDSIAQKTKPEPKLELSADSNIPDRTLVPIPTKREFQNVITPVGINHLPITLDPLGKWVYIMNNESNSVSGFKIKPISGGLTWVSTVQAGSYPSSMVINPYAKFAYVANPHSNNISMYEIDPDTGNLIPSTDFFAGISPQSLVMTPDGKFIYVADANPGIPNVSMFTVNPLTGVTTPGPILEVKPSVTTLGIDPKGRFLFATSSDDNNVMAFAINRETGELTPGAITKTGSRPRGITVDPTGRFAYIVNVGSNNISEYSIDQKNGTLSSLGLVLPTQPSPTSLTLDRAGKYAYSTIAASDIILVLSIDPDKGFLTLKSTVKGGKIPVAIVLDPKGHFAYVTNYGSNAISIYSVDPLYGNLHLLDASHL